MPLFTVTGEVDPFLHVSMKRGERIFCESDAMVMMEANLELKGQMTGGLGSALMRRFANGESFFQQHIEALRGDGDCLLAPTLPGAIQVMDVGARQYLLADGAFVAATSTIELKVRTQSIGTALFGQTGGFFLMETSGTGQVAVSGFGSVFELDVTPEKDVIIDNAHVVCWDNTLQYKMAVTTGESKGIIGNLMNSVKSGEGMVLRFSGNGRVVVCSRNRVGFLTWIRTKTAG